MAMPLLPEQANARAPHGYSAQAKITPTPSPKARVLAAPNDRPPLHRGSSASHAMPHPADIEMQNLVQRRRRSSEPDTGPKNASEGSRQGFASFYRATPVDDVYAHTLDDNDSSHGSRVPCSEMSYVAPAADTAGHKSCPASFGPAAAPLGLRMDPLGLPRPMAWLEFYARVGELCMMSAQPGIKRQDRTAYLLAQTGLPHTSKITSELFGAKKITYLVTPSLCAGNRKKLRVGYALHHGPLAIVGVHLPEAWLSRAQFTGTSIPPYACQGLVPFIRELVFAELFGNTPIEDVINDDGKLYAVTSYHSGLSLERLVQSHLAAPLRGVLARQVLFAMSKTLRHMQQRRVVHRRICREHIFWSKEDIVLGAFGRAHFLGESPNGGKMPYPSPEYIQSPGVFDHGGDAWGLGMTLLHLINRDAPFLPRLVTQQDTDIRHLVAQDVQDYRRWYQDHYGQSRAVGMYPKVPYSFVTRQLDAAVRKAAEVDAALTALVVTQLLCPQPEDRLGGDKLVAEAANLCLQVPTGVQDALTHHMHVLANTPPSRAFDQAQKGLMAILPAWRAGVLGP